MDLTLQITWILDSLDNELEPSSNNLHCNKFFNTSITRSNSALNQQDHLQWNKSQLTPYSPALSIGKPMRFAIIFYHLRCNVLSGVTEQSLWKHTLICEASRRRRKTLLSREYIFLNSRIRAFHFSSRLIQVVQTIKEYCGCPRQQRNTK